MDDELTKIALDAGAPIEVLDQLWFHIFCIQFADYILTIAEQEFKKNA